MKTISNWLLVAALLLLGGVPPAIAATQIQLKQSDGSITVLGGSGDSAKVTCGNCSGTGASFVDDAAFTPGSDSGAPAMGMFDDVAPDSVNEGDVGAVRMSGNRNLYTTIRDAAGNERGANVDASNRILVKPTGGVTPADNTANPTDAITVFSLNGCYDGATWDLCVKGTAGSGTVDANTTRTAEATDSQLSTDIAAIKTAVQLIDDDQTGASVNHHVSVGTTEDETEIKATAGRLLSIQITNSAATVAYFRCANLTAANTTPGTSTVFYGLAVPGATTGAGITANFGPMGIAFSTALTCWVVTGKAESDVAEVGANDVQWNIQYK